MACARFEPPGLSAKAADSLQADIAQELVASGQTWFATLLHDGELWMRFNLVNIHTRERHIRKLVELLHETARGLS